MLRETLLVIVRKRQGRDGDRDGTVRLRVAAISVRDALRQLISDFADIFAAQATF
jgi:hypothetical protein